MMDEIMDGMHMVLVVCGDFAWFFLQSVPRSLSKINYNYPGIYSSCTRTRTHTEPPYTYRTSGPNLHFSTSIPHQPSKHERFPNHPAKIK